MKKTISITVDVEEWFHTEFFNVENVIKKYFKGNYPQTDVVNSVIELIKLFDKYQVRATFFVLGETAVRYPKLIFLIEKSKHEFACHGYFHNKKYNNLNEFRDDLIKYKKNIKNDVKGYRHPNFDIDKNKLKIIKELGFEYDSSIVPCRNISGWYGNPELPIEPFKYQLNGNSIKEFPIAVSTIFRLPGGGGWYLRNIGYWWTKNIIKSSLKKFGYTTIYIHPWEISNNNPSFKEIPFHVYRKTGNYTLKSIEKIIKKFKKYSYINFDNIASAIKFL